MKTAGEKVPLRLYMGGLSEAVSENEVKDRIGTFGKVTAVEFKRKTNEKG